MVNAAIVGLGWWGRVIVDAVQGKSSRIQFTRGATPHPEKVTEFAAGHRLPVVSDYNEVLADPAIDAVVLTTPHSLHVDQVAAAAAAGKHVYCEKPLALDLAEAERAISACLDAGVLLGLGADKRFLPAMIELTELLGHGALGAPIHVEGQYSNPNSARGLSGAWRNAEGESPGGGLTGPGLHILDAMVGIVGPLAEADARLAEHDSGPPAIDSLVARLRFEGGATGALTCVRPVPDCFRLQVHGSRGWAEVRQFNELTVSLLGMGSEVRHFDADLAVEYPLERFAEAIEGGQPFPIGTESMLDTVAALEAVIGSLESGSVAEAPRHSRSGGAGA